MRKILIIVLFFSINGLYAQKSNYKINDNIYITEIELDYRQDIRKYEKEEPFGIRFIRLNDSISGFYLLSYKFLAKEKEDPMAFWNHRDINKIPTSEFDRILNSFKKINVHKRRGSFGKDIHSKYWTLKLSSHTYTIRIIKHNPRINTEKRNLIEFLTICEKMMSYIKTKN